MIDVTLKDANGVVVEGPKQCVSLDAAVEFASRYMHCHAGALLAGSVEFGPVAYDEIPDTCPNVECEEEDSFTTAVDVTIYDVTRTEFGGMLAHGEPPEDQSVRVWCRECGQHLPLSESLFEKIGGAHDDS